ncbi:ATP-dependent 6-phosphofructokinase subunit alpha [Frankliniella fusca]|uniref:ATP-dependent 6-phosphofructokinase subunit alpha n=1 Tax=Frankliniella fusca TaxID=407009 RepID=A0AAE1LJ55_9NEOP|nr:ATP-dependent 6-phosphofructokinase subunit alpha [Frankliniella fusca]
MESFQGTLIANVIKILPHKNADDAQIIVDFVIREGVKKVSDLRHITIASLKTICDTVDASDLYEEWQAQYGKKNDSVPSTSRSREPLSERNSETPTARFTMPLFDKNSPFIPAGVRQAIDLKKRPSVRDRQCMVDRIVDHLKEKVPNLVRSDFDSVADNLVQLYPESFKDTLAVSRHGSDSLRSQFKVKFDNLNRKPTKSRDQTTSAPASYGCLQFNPACPEGETEQSLVRRRDNLKSLFDHGRRHWDWRRIKVEMEITFYLQRKNINGPVSVPKPSSRRRRPQPENEENEQSGDEQAADNRAMTVVELKTEWPCLFKAAGMNYHLKLLTGSDFILQLDTFLAEDGKFLVEYLASKGETQAATRRKMIRSETRGNMDAYLAALIKMLTEYFSEDEAALVSFVEDTTDIDEVDLNILPADKTPHLVIAGPSLFNVSRAYLSIDGVMVASCESLREGFGMLFSSYFMLGIRYPNSVACTLSYVQKAIANIAPERGTKCSSSLLQSRANTKAAKLHNNFAAFKDSLDEND